MQRGSAIYSKTVVPTFSKQVRHRISYSRKNLCGADFACVQKAYYPLWGSTLLGNIDYAKSLFLEATILYSFISRNISPSTFHTLRDLESIGDIIVAYGLVYNEKEDRRVLLISAFEIELNSLRYLAHKLLTKRIYFTVPNFFLGLKEDTSSLKLGREHVLQQLYGNLISENTKGTKNPWVWSTIHTMFYMKNPLVNPACTSQALIGRNLYDYNILRRLIFLYGTQKRRAVAYSSEAYSWQLGFQFPATGIMEAIIDLHHDIMLILFLVSIFVS
jgi:hypothetical protein